MTNENRSSQLSAERATTAPRSGVPDERRHLTVLFCDLQGFTELSARLDPEDLLDVIREYQRACEAVVRRFDGTIAQHLGDGLLVYFGYPSAHEDDARRAVQSGLGMVEAVSRLNPELERDKGVRLAVRIGIHSGLVVAADLGSGEAREQLAIGETPNVAARLQQEAQPDTVLVSAATERLVRGFFACRRVGTPRLAGLAGRADARSRGVVRGQLRDPDLFAAHDEAPSEGAAAGLALEGGAIEPERRGHMGGKAATMARRVPTEHVGRLLDVTTGRRSDGGGRAEPAHPASRS